jgi:adenylate cyclase, class 2
MAEENQENEVKFYLADLKAFESQVLLRGATLKRPRVFELNLRFDLPGGELTAAHRVLRLRQDDRARLTYKGPAQSGQPVSMREEIEIVVSDFDQARMLLESLGYIVSVQYEKWRTTYRLGKVEIDLDEMPFGCFCELEGPDALQIKSIADELSLKWDARVLESYLAIFDRVKTAKKLGVNHLTFDEFKNIPLTVKDLGLIATDQP